MENVLLKSIRYKIERTGFGEWRRYMSTSGQAYSEFTSHASLLRLPLFHYTSGINPETGSRKVATGIIAVGRLARGGLAIGHASFGVVAVGQLAVGLFAGLGQAATGIYVLGQLAIGILFGAGQMASGETAIGQFAMGYYVLAQMGFGEHVWTPETADPVAVEHFRSLVDELRNRVQGVFEMGQIDSSS